MRRLLSILGMIASIPVSVSFAGDAVRPRPVVPDRHAPDVVLHTFDIAPLRYVFEVDANDSGGIAQVLVAINGSVVEARMHEPWLFFFGDGQTTISTPFEVCAQAEDRAGNWSPQNCEVVTGPNPCQTNGDCPAQQFCYRPAYRCDGPGGCVDRPCFFCCLDDLSPLCWPTPNTCGACGCDGQHYFSECDAHREGVNVAHPGQCN